MSAYIPYTPAFNGLTGEEIQARADAHPGMPPTGAGITIQAVIYTFGIICTIVLSLRVYVRWKLLESGQRWGFDDYLAVAGFVPYLPACVIGIVGTYYGVGAPDSDIDPFLKIKASEYQLIYELVYFGSSMLTKVSIVFTILRICENKMYKYLMYAVLAINGVTSTASLVFLFADCRPFATRWNPFLGHCAVTPPIGWFVTSYVGTSILAFTDLVVATTPYFILRHLQMNRRKKISVIAVLGLGAIASLFAVLRIAAYPSTDQRYHPNNILVSEAKLVIYSHLEGSFAIIGCNLPPLRKMLANFYRGSYGSGSGLKSTGVLSGGGRGTQLSSLNLQGKTKTTVTTNKTWDRLSDDDDSARHIIRETEIRIETSNKSADELSNLGFRGITRNMV
ncbi:hypothetical protein F5Y16DRAFT_385933 [Xylariaceae sp. FL0255]|nr:hypothetical protein F5Y16DRAFT_385933 [Xylariaceae sp. FL0255]